MLFLGCFMGVRWELCLPGWRWGKYSRNYFLASPPPLLPTSLSSCQLIGEADCPKLSHLSCLELFWQRCRSLAASLSSKLSVFCCLPFRLEMRSQMKSAPVNGLSPWGSLRPPEAGEATLLWESENQQFDLCQDFCAKKKKKRRGGGGRVEWGAEENFCGGLFPFYVFLKCILSSSLSRIHSWQNPGAIPFEFGP